MIGIVREIAFGAAANPAVNLLQRRANPQGVDAKLLEIIELAAESFKIAAVEGANFLHTVFVAAIAVVIRRIAIHEAVRQHKVDGGVLPAEWRGFIGFGPFKQEQTVAVRGGLQGDFPLLHGGRLLTVEIPYHGAFRESVFHLDGERFTVPFRALACDLCDGFLCGTLYRQHQRWRARARINAHLIIALAEQAPLRWRSLAGLKRHHLIEFNGICGLPARIVKIEGQRTSTLRELCMACEHPSAFGVKGRKAGR
ncbi:hypothetical protein D3C81_1457950 [compost metagenome]